MATKLVCDGCGKDAAAILPITFIDGEVYQGKVRDAVQSEDVCPELLTDILALIQAHRVVPEEPHSVYSREDD